MSRLTKGQLLYYWNLQDKCNAIKDYDEYIFLKSTGDHLCIYQTADETVIAVDATDNDHDNGNKEWMSNFDFSPPISGFHKGFYKTAKLFYNQIKEMIQTKPVTIQGHSRGGGIAPILAYFAWCDGIKINKVVTFAGPRSTTIGGHAKLKKANLEVHRVEAKIDIVDNMPPKVTVFPFPPAIWRHYETYNYDLPGVEGSDHLNIGKAIMEMRP